MKFRKEYDSIEKINVPNDIGEHQQKDQKNFLILENYLFKRY